MRDWSDISDIYHLIAGEKIVIESGLSVRPTGLPDIVSNDWVLNSIAVIHGCKLKKDYVSADYIKRVLSEFVSIQEGPETIDWSWKPLTVDSVYWPKT